MTRLIPVIGAVAFLCSVPAFGGTIAVGDISFVENNGVTQFYVDNDTGVTDGCSTPNGFPACTVVNISGTLTYSYVNNSSVTVNGSVALPAPLGPDVLNPAGDEAYAPAPFAFATTDILSVSFAGTLTPVNLTTDTGSFTSDGTVVSVDVTTPTSSNFAGDGIALLSTNSAVVTSTPEPSSALLLAGGVAFFCGFRRWRRCLQTR